MITAEQAYLAGYFVGDGSVSWDLRWKSPFAVVKLLSNEDDRIRLAPKLEVLGLTLEWKFFDKSSPVVAEAYLPVIKHWVVSDLLDLSKFPHDKQFDVQKIFASGQSKAFVMGLWDSDGRVGVHRTVSGSLWVQVYFSTIHKKLAQDVEKLLGMHEVETSLFKVKKKPPRSVEYRVNVLKKSHAILRSWS